MAESIKAEPNQPKVAPVLPLNGEDPTLAGQFRLMSLQGHTHHTGRRWDHEENLDTWPTCRFSFCNERFKMWERLRLLEGRVKITIHDPFQSEEFSFHRIPDGIYPTTATIELESGERFDLAWKLELREGTLFFSGMGSQAGPACGNISQRTADEA